MVFEYIALRTAWKEVKRSKGKQSVFEYLKVSKTPEVVVVFVEDLAALVGLGIALVGIMLTQVTGILVIDGITSVLIGVMLCVSAFFLGQEFRSLIIGEAASPSVHHEIFRTASNFEEVDKVGDLMTLHMGQDHIMVAFKVRFVDGLTTDNVEDVIRRIESAIVAKVPAAKQIFVEPARLD